MNDYKPQRYAAADSIVAQLVERRAEVWDVVTRGTLTSHIVYDDDRVHTVAPRLPYMIEEADEAARSLTAQIERWQIRGRLYRDFIAKHPHPTSDEVQDELLQIETYVAYQQGYEPPEEDIAISSDPVANIQNMADYFKEEW